MSQHAELLATLHRHGVEFIVVGGLAAVIQGAPVHTLDVDVVYARTPENIQRALAALTELDVPEIAGLPIRVLTLERLIAVKEKLDRPKDRLMLVVLEATRDERLKK